MSVNKKFYSLQKGAAAVLLAGGLALTATSAQALLIDGFGDDLAPVTDITADGTPVSSGFHAITDTDLINVTREVSVSKTGGIGNTSVSASMDSGAFNHSQGAGSVPAEGFSMVKWVFDPADLSAETALQLQVLYSDSMGPISLSLFDGVNVATSNVVAPTTLVASGLIFQLSDFAAIDLTAVNMALLMIDGTNTPAWDVTVDLFSTPVGVSESATLGLMGLGLAGLGLAARRRKTH